MTNIVESLQKAEHDGYINNLDTDLFLAEESDGRLWMTIKYFNKEGKENMGGILIQDNNVVANQSIRDTINSVKEHKKYLKKYKRERAWAR
jgi:hypothetical protein